MRSPPARKRFSQNFLVDAGMIERIVRSVGPRSDDRILEIGPGHGAITRGLLSAGQVLAVEIDRDLAAELESTLPELDLRCADVLKVDLVDLLGSGQWRVVGNLPYNISTPVLFRMLEHAELISDMTFMLQAEVVDRICASPGGGDWGRLGVMIQYRCEVARLFRVPPECFAPRPKVHSTMVRLQPRPPVRVAESERLFAKVVRLAFGQRRKTLRNTLKPLLAGAPWPDVDVDPQVRPETLSVDDFVRLSDALGAGGVR